MASELVESTKACPQCAAACPITPGYTPWCESCNWNVAPPREQHQTRVRGRLGKWMGASALTEAGSGRPHPGFRLAAYVYSTFIYLVVAVLAVGAVALVWLSFPNPFAIVAGFLMLGTAYVAFPRFPKMPAGVVDRDRYPALISLADRIADELGATRIDALVINGQYNAFFGRCGLRGTRVMGLGVPLMSALDGQELAALMAHELAHDVNHDPLRGRYVEGAYSALLEMHGLLAPQGFRVSGRGWQAAETGAAAVFANISMRFLSFITRPFLLVFEVLVRRDSQTAEYRADALAADLAGSDAATGLLRALHMQSLLVGMAGAVVTRRGESARLFDDFRHKLETLPPRERARIDRSMALEETVVDSTHPPSAERLRVISSRSASVPRLVVEDDEWRAIRAELEPLEPRYAAAWVERSRDRLYR